MTEEQLTELKRDSIVRTLVPMTMMLHDVMSKYEISDGSPMPPKAYLELVSGYNNYAVNLYAALGVTNEEYEKICEEYGKQTDAGTKTLFETA